MDDANLDSSNVELTDDNIVIRSDSLEGVSSNWSSSISGVNIGAIDVVGSFTSLMDNGIGTGLFPSLDTAIKNLETSALSMASSIGSYVNNQTSVDRNGTTSARNRTGFNNNGGSASSYSNTTTFDDTGKNELVDDFNDAQDINDVDEESIIEEANLDEVDIEANGDEVGLSDDYINLEASLIPIYKEIRDCVLNMDDYDQIEFINELCNIASDIDLKELIYNEDNATILKDQILKNVSSKKLIEILENLDPSTIQKTMKELLTNGETVSDFSKIVFSVFESGEETADVSSASSDLFKTYSSILDDDNLQEQLSYLYEGNLTGDNSETITNFTKDFVDIVATAENISSSELLNNSQYSNVIFECAKDLTKSFSYLSASVKMGQEASNSLHSNVTIKES